MAKIRSGYLYNPYQVHFYDRLVQRPLFGFMKNWSDNACISTFLAHLPLNLFVFLLLVGLFTFGPGYQPISILFMPSLAILLLYTRSTPSYWHLSLVAYPAVVLGTFFAYAGTFAYDTNSPWTTGNTVYSLIAAVINSIFVLVAVVLDRAISNFSAALPSFIEIFFGFPFIWAGIWAFIGRVSPFGDFFNWGIALALVGVEDLTVGTTWLFGGWSGGCFIFAVIVSSFLYILRRYFEVCYPQDETFSEYAPPPVAKIADIRIPFLHPVVLVVYILIILFGFGSFYSQIGPNPGMFYQHPLELWAPKTVQMSCLIGGSFESTIRHLQTSGLNSKLLMWSEQSQIVDDEQKFLDEGLSISKRFDVMLGLGYTLPLANDSAQSNGYTYQNKFAFILPPSQVPFASGNLTHSGNSTLNANSTDRAMIGFIQQKVHPVPLIELGSQPGPRKFQFVDTEFGRFGAAIGFDFDYSTLSDMYYEDIGFVMQPARTWGPIAELHVAMNRIRAVENGFTTFRCQENGISGVFDQFYRVLSEQITLGQGDGFVYKVPMFGKSWTLVRFFLDYVGIMAMAILLYWILFLGGWWLRRTIIYFRTGKRPEMDEDFESQPQPSYYGNVTIRNAGKSHFEGSLRNRAETREVNELEEIVESSSKNI